MSNEAPEVVIAKDNGLDERWFYNKFYRKEGQKLVFKSEVLKFFCWFTVLGAVLGSLFYGETESDLTRGGIETPRSINGSPNDIELQKYSDTKIIPKKAFKGKPKVYARLSVVSSSKKIQIPLGASVRGELMTGGTNGPIKVKLLEDLESHGEIYIKEGATLWGRGSSTEDRLLVSFTKFVDESGKSKDISATAYDIGDEILGLKGSIIGRTSKKIMAGAGLGIAGAFQTMQESENMGGVAVTKPSIGNALLNGASTAALGIAEQELEELKQRQTIIEVKKGTKMIIVFGEI